MNDVQRAFILYKALGNVCKVLRQHPTELDWYLEDPNRIRFLTGGSQRDPEGKEIMAYFLEEAMKELGLELEEEEKKEDEVRDITAGNDNSDEEQRQVEKRCGIQPRGRG